MKVVATRPDTATVDLTADELMILANAINESKQALEDWEFATRMGAPRSEAEALRKEISDLLDSLEAP
jgi:hypothetical protein